eukprot:5270200-Prymnesium_polylepis.2
MDNDRQLNTVMSHEVRPHLGVPYGCTPPTAPRARVARPPGAKKQLGGAESRLWEGCVSVPVRRVVNQTLRLKETALRGLNYALPDSKKARWERHTA